MIPIQLTLQGLYSYQGKQTIDFTRLTSAGLFGIFGTVGSGKSTILEAITFALYGRTDRLNLSGDNRNYNMMNLKSKELLIDFIFESGSQQTRYRSIVKGKRNSKRFEEVKTPERSIYRKVNEEWLPIDQEDLQEIIGLNYENFKRTIIIPQGQFQEFLQLGNTDRTRMLKELFNLGKYEFYYKVVSLESANNERQHLLEGRLKQLGEVEEEQVVEYEEQLKDLTVKIAEKKTVLQTQLQKEAQLKKLQELQLKMTTTEQGLRELEEQKPAYRTLEVTIARYELCRFRFMHLLNQLEELEKKTSARSAQIEADRIRLEKQQTSIEKIEAQLTNIKPIYEKREEMKTRAADLAILLRIKKSESLIAKEKGRLLSGDEYLNNTIKQINKLEEKKQEIQEEIKNIRNNMPDLTQLSTIRSWHLERNNLEKRLKEIDEEINKYNDQVKEIQQERIILLNEPLLKGLSKVATYAEYEQQIAIVEKRLKTLELETIEKEHHLLVREQLKEYARELKDGTPCPLCGSNHHPNPYKHEGQGKELQHIAIKKQELETQLVHLSSIGKHVALLQNRHMQVAKNLEEWSEKRKEILREINTHQDLFVWEKFHEEEELDKTFEAAERQKEKEKTLEASLTNLITQLQQEEKNKERYRSAIEEIRTLVTVHKTTLATLSEQLQLIDPQLYQVEDPQQIEKEQQELLLKYQQVVKQYDERSEQLQHGKREKDSLIAAIQINNRELGQEQLSFETLQKQFDEELNNSPFLNLNEVKQVLATKLNIEEEKQKVATFNEQIQLSNSLLNQLRIEIGDQSYDSDEHSSLLKEIDLLRDEERNANQQHIEISLLLKQLKSSLENKTKLSKELEELELRAENIRTMKSLFKASGFVNWISTVYLQNLCNAANDRFFRLTRQKLSLEITSDNSFQVRDYMNEGKVRSVKTLSGGQTFQASLSLALALADNIQQITQSDQNFFFLDEGFGSLDKESLDIVFDTLKSLRRENRIVGIISHVEEMQQEIGTHLRIENNPERGSLIFRSWEE